ncbi:MAG: cysteine desulfurase [Spirochaetales bacterium]|nr:cysteine desulfurase [Spirochaetales bacterium]MCF7937907.1 cysteine desulfurase [Spirochaetales bacterium]
MSTEKPETVYLDHNATTPLHPAVKQEMTEAMELFGNPSSMHGFGREARANVEHARKTVASFIGADSANLMFTGSGSEANNTVLSIFSCSGDSCSTGSGRTGEKGETNNRKTIITTRIEHPCVLETSRCLAGQGTPVKYLDVDRYGKINMDQLSELLTDDVGLVSIMMANNEIGTLQDISEAARLVHEHGALLHTDAVQAVGKIPVDVDDLGVDFLSMSAHKIYGPKGVGALYVRPGTPFCPFVRGGHQEQGRRAGTENTLGILGMARAVQMRSEEMEDELHRIRALREQLVRGIESSIDDVVFNGHPEDYIPHTVNVSFPGAEGESILLYLDMAGIAVSTGSACASGSLDPSHVLLATGTDAERAHGSIRISMGRDTTEEQIGYLLEVLPPVIRKIRGMSTAYIGGNTYAQTG